MNYSKGFPILGATTFEKGVNFGIYCKGKKEVSLKLFKNDKNRTFINSIVMTDKNKTGDIYHIFVDGITEGDLYSWVIDGVNILDPYSLSYTFDEMVADKKNIVVARKMEVKSHLDTPINKTIIYETHIKFFTQDSSSKVKLKGTYLGFIEKIPYLKELGITAVEFLPVFEWDDYTGRYNSKSELLKNSWGYNPISFFAPTKKFLASENKNSADEIVEFKKLVDELHKNGIEVYLDIVYNHTAENGNNGNYYNFKMMDNNTYYMMENNNTGYKNYSGCGNTFNCNTVMGRDIVINSLRYWYTEMGVDGFRFDLAPILGRDSNGQWGRKSILDDLVNDPVLSKCKLISESWDLGGYYVGDMPTGWKEWNGKYRDVVRKFIKGEFGQVLELLKRILGSPDIFKKGSSSPYSSINFITCHDGFTMYDLVSYNTKHNIDNGEDNRDGENNNNSYNWGVEGNTTDKNIIALRKKQIKNLYLILFVSQGIPMIYMGDEMGRTQLGNNNAYCQDNESVWVDWNKLEENRDIFNFVKNMIAFRKKYDIFSKDRYWDCDDSMNKDVRIHGVKLNSPDYSYHSLSIALELHDKNSNSDIYVALNSYYGDLTFELPKLKGKKWYRLVDTALNDDENFKENLTAIEDGFYLVKSRSSIILISK